MKKYSLTAMFTFFLILIGVTEIWAQKDYKAEELLEALHAKNCTAAISIAKLIQSPDYTNKDGISLLMTAAASNCTEVVKTLLTKGANINLEVKEIGGTALINAIGNRDSETVKLLLEEGANVDSKTLGGFTGLMLASMNGYSEVVKLLLQYGANVELRTEDSGQNAIMLASEEGEYEVVKILSDKNEKTNFQTISLDLESAIKKTSKIVLESVFNDLNRDNYATGFFIPANRPLIICLSMNDCKETPALEKSGLGSTLKSTNTLAFIDYIHIHDTIIKSRIEYKSTLETAWYDENSNPVYVLKSDSNGFPKMKGYQFAIIGGSLKIKADFTINSNTLTFENGSMSFSDFKSPAVFTEGTTCKYNGILHTYSNGKWVDTFSAQKPSIECANIPAGSFAMGSPTKEDVRGNLEDQHQVAPLSAFKMSKYQFRYENFKKLNKGMSPDEIVSHLSFEADINKSFFGGIFIGIGLLSKDSQTPSSYTGSLNLHEFVFIFDNGKLKEKSIDSTKIGLETISGKYIYKFIGKTQTSWSLVNGKFNSNTVAVEYTEEEKRIQEEKYKQRQINYDKRLKELTDSLTNNGYKIISAKGFDSFIIGKTRLQEIVSTLGANYLREDYRKYSSKIYYPDLGISFYVYYDKNTNNGTLFEIRLRSPFKGFHIEGGQIQNFWGVVLDKTTINDLKSHNYTYFRVFMREGEDNSLFVQLSDDMAVKYVVVFESAIKGYDKTKDYTINEFRISVGRGD